MSQAEHSASCFAAAEGTLPTIDAGSFAPYHEMPPALGFSVTCLHCLPCQTKTEQTSLRLLSCFNESLLRWLVGVTLRAICDVHLSQQDLVGLSLLQLALCASGYAPGSEPLSWETATTQLDWLYHCCCEYITTYFCRIKSHCAALPTAGTLQHCNRSTRPSLSSNSKQNRVPCCHIPLSLSSVRR